MTRIGLAVWLTLGSVVIAGCESGASSGEGDGDRASTNDTCLLRTTLSGGIDATFGDTSQACVYSSRTVGFAPLGPKAVVLITVRNIERGQTGSFAATIDVTANKETWAGATCTVDVVSNVKEEAASDAGVTFDRYLLKGSGSCSSPAVYRGDAGAKPPVTIAPFTFTFPTLFY